MPAQAALDGADAPGDVGCVLCLQHHLAALGSDAARLDQSAVLELSGEDRNGIALQRAQVHGLVGGRLQLQHDAFEPATGQLHLLAGGEDGRAVGRLNQRIGPGLDVRRDQHHVAAARDDLAVDLQRAGSRTAVAKDQPPRERIRIAHAQGRSGIDYRAGSHGNAGRVDQHDAPVGRERAVDGRRVVAQHAVDRQTARVGLHEARGAARRDGKALPVDGRVIQARAVLRRDDEAVALLDQARLALDDLRARGLRQRLAHPHERGRQRQRHAGRSEPRHRRAIGHRWPRLGARSHAATRGSCPGSIDLGWLFHELSIAKAALSVEPLCHARSRASSFKDLFSKVAQRYRPRNAASCEIKPAARHCERKLSLARQ